MAISINLTDNDSGYSACCINLASELPECSTEKAVLQRTTAYLAERRQ